MISTKNRAYLRSLSNTLEALYQIGKGGVTPAVAQTLDDAEKEESSASER